MMMVREGAQDLEKNGDLDYFVEWGGAQGQNDWLNEFLF